jgi:hypothetical protein
MWSAVGQRARTFVLANVASETVVTAEGRPHHAIARDALPDLAPSSAIPLTGRASDGTTEQRFGVYRALLPPDGQHELAATARVGIQVVGYGRFTSYQYPGGLNLNLITEPPPRPEPPR